MGEATTLLGPEIKARDRQQLLTWSLVAPNNRQQESCCAGYELGEPGLKYTQETPPKEEARSRERLHVA